MMEVANMLWPYFLLLRISTNAELIRTQQLGRIVYVNGPGPEMNQRQLKSLTWTIDKKRKDQKSRTHTLCISLSAEHYKCRHTMPDQD